LTYSPTPNLRQASITDAAGISLLILDSQRQFCFGEFTVAGQALMEEACSAQAVETYLLRGDCYFVAEYGTALVGVLGVRNVHHLSHCFVSTAWHRQSIATRLWALAKQACYDGGNSGYYTVNSSTYARRVYSHWGFVSTGPAVTEQGLLYWPMRLDGIAGAAGV
jgi:hypothetical protein